jgi:hypothetical protein
MDVVSVSSEVADRAKTVRFRKPSPKPTALILKIDPKSLQVNLVFGHCRVFFSFDERRL